jgi:SAM-dependent methyltransferase
MAEAPRSPWPRLALAWLLAAAGLWLAATALAAHLTIGVGLLFLAHAPLSAAVAALLRLPRWWVLLAALPAPAAALVLALGLPGWVFALGFALLLAVFWSVARTRVPLYLSGPAEWRALAGLLPPGPCAFLDVGSGLGGPALALARLRPDARCEGVEIAPLPWLVSWLRARLVPQARRPRLRRCGWEGVDLADYDLVFAFLSPAAMPPLWAQACTQMRPGTLLVSCEFEIPGKRPWRSLDPPGGRRLLVWRMAGERAAQAPRPT